MSSSMTRKDKGEQNIEQPFQRGVNLSGNENENLTAVHIAACFGHLLALKTLLVLGARLLPSTTYGNSPLHLAVLHGHAEAVGILLRHHSDTEQRNV